MTEGGEPAGDEAATQSEPATLNRAARFALLVVLPFYPLVPRFSLAGPLGSDDLLPMLAVAIVTLALVAGRRWPRRSPALWGLALFAVVATLPAVLNAGGFGAAVVSVARVAGRLAVYGALLVGIAELLTASDRRKLLWAIAAVAMLEAGIGVGCYAAKIHGPWQTGMLHYPVEQMPSHGRVRVQGTFGGEVLPGHSFLNRANFYSAYLMVGLMALLAVATSRRHRWLLLGGTTLLLAGILVSYSRMSLIAAFAGIALVALLHRRFVAVGGAALLVIVALLVSPPLRGRFLEAGTDRWGQWQIATRVIAEHPALGVGDGRYLEEAIRLSQGVDVPQVRTAHNSVLYAMASYGIPAGLALLALYVALAVTAVQSYRRRRDGVAAAQLALVVAFVLHDVTNNLFFIPEVALAFWCVWAAAEEE